MIYFFFDSIFRNWKHGQLRFSSFIMFDMRRNRLYPTILVCDDDKQIVEAINIYLTGEGFNVIKAYDGYEALELLEKNEVNLMIVDVMMPGLDGSAPHLRSARPAVSRSSSSPRNPRIPIRS